MTDEVHDPLRPGSWPHQLAPSDAELRTFLIADVRGYTAFTHRHGDERAAKLAAKFARVSREVVLQHQGSVLELRGDEALCVFISPRQAVRAAVALQRRFVVETSDDSELPLPVGIGIDVGEAVPVEGGYRSGAINLAARLCSIARPGEILATGELTHLARQVDGLTYVAKTPVRVKGLADPVRPMRVVPEGEDPVVQLLALGAGSQALPVHGPRRLLGPLRRKPWFAVVAAVAALAVVAALIAVVTGGGSARSLSALRENVAAALDAGSGRLVSQTPVGASPSALAVTPDAIWVANREDGSVSRVDRATGAVTQTTAVGEAPTALAVGAGGVWVADSGSGDVTKLDPATGRILQTVPVGSGPSALAFDGAKLWVVDTIGGTLYSVDPGAAQARLVARVGAAPSGVAAAAGRVWVSSSGSNSVLQIDAASGDVVQSVPVGNDPRGIAVIGPSLWVTNNLDGTVTRIATATAAVTATLPVGSGPVAVTGSRNAVWIADADGRSISRIDPRTNRVVASTMTGSTPTDVVFGGNRLWVSAAADPALHRGGTLTASFPSAGSLDPATGYDYLSESVDGMMYDGLVTLRRTAGAAGGTVVPDLSLSLPTVSADGLVYAFRLRAGIRWSSGRPVTGEDVRRGLERTVAARVWPVYGDIVGAQACTPKSCDLSRGIRVDDATHVVSIRVVSPDADFLYKLALLGAVAVPAETPIGSLGDAVLPSTGPYRVASHSSGQTTLVRNALFRQWSVAAQPAGFPDRMVFTVHADGGPGQNWTPLNVDWSTSNAVPDLATLRARYGNQLQTTPTPGVAYLFLNTSRPPFNDVRARRAVAFAIDRSAVQANWAVPGQVSCQILPPLIPGYEPYCPYTLRPGATGEWQAPDLLSAQRLVRESRTAGAVVRIYAPAGMRAMQQIVQTMRTIGFRARVVFLPPQNYFPALNAAFPNVEAGFAAWGADYPAPSNFLETQFACDQRNVVAGGSNFSQFCDRSLDRQMRAAEQLQVRSPGAALARWSSIEREVVDAAPQVGLLVPTWVDIVSRRLGNQQRNPILGPIYDESWVL